MRTIMAGLILVSMTLSACASGPARTWHQAGVSRTQFDDDLDTCIQAGRDAANGIPTPYYSHAGSSAQVAGSAFGAGLARGIAQGQAQVAATRSCFEERGYRQVYLSEGEEAEFRSLDRGEPRQAFAFELATQPRDEASFVPYATEEDAAAGAAEVEESGL